MRDPAVFREDEDEYIEIDPDLPQPGTAHVSCAAATWAGRGGRVEVARGQEWRTSSACCLAYLTLRDACAIFPCSLASRWSAGWARRMRMRCSRTRWTPRPQSGGSPSPRVSFAEGVLADNERQAREPIAVGKA